MSCECRGSGWIDVDDAYVDRLCPMPIAGTEEERENARLKRAALRNTVKPCPAHNPGGHARWLASQEERPPAASPPPPDLRRVLE